MVNYRKIYEQYFGAKIPKGYHVHHKDMNHWNNNPLNLEALVPDDHAKKHGFLNNWIMSMARASSKEYTKQARAEGLRKPEVREKARVRMIGKKIALGIKHTEEQRKKRAIRMRGNNLALGKGGYKSYIRTAEMNKASSESRLGKKRGPYKNKLTIP